ncbi:MAG: peptidoglycan hydrolase CwlO-like protein [Verrucomicrobiales bacterium]|jgi:peptidoglycan hydrolase CwlO-like protein
MIQQRKAFIQLGMSTMIIGGLALTGCKEEPTNTGGSNDGPLQERLETAEEKAGLIKEELDDLKAEAKDLKKKADEEKKTQENNVVELQKKLREAKQANEALQEEFDTYQEDYKVSVRQNAKGVELGNVALSSGRNYTGVVVSKWTPAALRVTHEGGNATIPFEELPATIQTVFLYDKVETAALLAQGEETVTTGRTRNPRATATAEPWPTKDPNGSPGGTSSSGTSSDTEHSGIVNEVAATALDSKINRLDASIAKGNSQLSALDKQVQEAIARGSDGKQRSLERKMEKLVVQIGDLRASRNKLMDQRIRVEKRG